MIKATNCIQVECLIIYPMINIYQYLLKFEALNGDTLQIFDFVYKLKWNEPNSLVCSVLFSKIKEAASAWSVRDKIA